MGGEISEIEQSGRGIFDCDEAYRSPQPADYERIFRTGMVVLDTNVLLNLYRSNSRTREDTLAVLTNLRERLWIPHQVLAEFWRSREKASIRHHHKSKAREASGALDKISRSAKDALDRWLTAVHLKDDAEVVEHIDTALKSLSQIVIDVKALIQSQAAKDALSGATGTNEDPVLGALEGLLQGRVGDPLGSSAYAKAVQEAQERADEEIPPGYEDFKNKPPEQAAGDYLLWRQILLEAESRKCDVLLVTGDIKPDWWIPQESDLPARPRQELVVEMKKDAGVRLFMLSPGEMLSWADQLFDLQVDENSVNDLKQLQSAKDATETVEIGWTAESLALFLEQLLLRYPPQAKAIIAAAANGGFVDRASVYELAGYPSNRQLKGFTRPIATIAKELEAQNDLAGTEPFLLRTVYGSETEPSWATGFRIPKEVIPLLREAYEDTELWPSGQRPEELMLAISLAESMVRGMEPQSRTPKALKKVADRVIVTLAAVGKPVPVDRFIRELEMRVEAWMPADEVSEA